MFLILEHMMSFARAKGEIEAYISSILFDDIITALRSKQVEPEEIKKVIIAIASACVKVN